MLNRTFILLPLLALQILFSVSYTYGQSVKNDTSYYETYPEKLTARVFLAQKFLKFTIPSSSQTDIEYKAHTKMNLGIGATYHNYSLNISYGFGFLNKDTSKGKTTGLNLQFHVYPRKWSIDLLALFPKGYYLFPKGYATTPGKYYLRPDIKMTLLGLSAYQVSNKEKFSYRAAITQNEWQKKSAGSFLYGGVVYHGNIKGDSALVPKSIQSEFLQAGIDNIKFSAIGVGIGYAYTLVIKQHFFMTASAIGNLDLTFTSEDGDAVQKKSTNTGVAPAVVAKAAVGYNSSTWNVSINGLGSAFWSKGSISPQNYYLPVGALRLVFCKKITLKKK